MPFDAPFNAVQTLQSTWLVQISKSQCPNIYFVKSLYRGLLRMCCPEVQCQLQAVAATEPCSRHAGAERVGGEGVMCRLVSNRGWGCDTYTLLQIIYAFTHCYKSYMYTIFINIMGGVLICIISQQDVAYMQRQWGAGGQRGKAGEGERECVLK